MHCHICEAEIPAGSIQCPACESPAQAASGAADAGNSTPKPSETAIPPQRRTAGLSRLDLPRGLTVGPPAGLAPPHKVPVATMLAVIAAVVVLLALAWLSTGTPPP